MAKKICNIQFDTLTDIGVENDTVTLKGFDSSSDTLHFQEKKCRIPLNPASSDCIVLRRQDRQPFICGKFFPLSDRYRNSYACLGRWILSKRGEDLILTPLCRTEHIRMEGKLLMEYLRIHGKIEIRGIKVRIFYYLFYQKKRRNRKKPLLIFSDRMDKAGDNGEAMFRYVQRYHKEEAECFFAVDPSSESGRQLSRIGRVIEPGGKEYKKLYWQGAVMVSSQAEDWIFRPYKGGTEAYKDLAYGTKFVFLQHGITKDDLSDWLNRANKNIGLLVTATRMEQDSFISGNYGYTDEQVKLIGFPRYDRLYSRPQKKITILLTWRYYLVELPDEKGKRMVKNNYYESTYHQMLKYLVGSPEFAAMAAGYGYTLQIMLHPCMEDIRESLQKEAAPGVVFLSYDQSYAGIFSESDLIITDYSSVAFDFAYLRKPVIYYQQDRDEFFGGMHMYRQGYYDYEEDGFGEVVTGREQLYDTVESYLQNQCTLKDRYRERIDYTFPWNDHKNCRRVYREIMRQITGKDSHAL